MISGSDNTVTLVSGDYSINDLATHVASILSARLSSRDILRLSQVVFLTVDEAADLLRVKPNTISTWISNGTIPVRYAGGRPLFLLAELLNWTLPEHDKHKNYRLSVAASSRIAADKLTVNRERKSSDAGL